MSRLKLVDIVSNGLIAAIYFVLTILNPFSFGLIQIRLAEMLCLLCFFKPSYFIGVTLGCVISNISSTLGIYDVIIGGSATLISCIFIGYISPKLWVGGVVSILINMFVVGTEMSIFLEVPIYLALLSIFISEFISLSIGYVSLYLLRNRKEFLKLIRADKHLEWRW